MNFVAIDFETANEKRSSPCSLGLTVVRNGLITEEKYWLMQPPENRFAPMNIMIHGIRPGDVADAPEFDQLWPEIQPYLEGRLVVAHNAAFDLSVIRNTLDYYGIPYPTLDYVCTMNLSKRFYPFLENAKLDTVNRFLGYEFDHHNAAADASACANILLAIAGELETEQIEELTSAVGTGIGHVYPGGYTRPGTTRGGRISEWEPLPVDVPAKKATISRSFFNGKGVVFTGPLKKYSRMEAAALVEKAGGHFLTSVSRKTNVLVTNTKNPTELLPSQMSTKLRKAMQLRQDGYSIEIINEDLFLTYLFE